MIQNSLNLNLSLPVIQEDNKFNLKISNDAYDKFMQFIKMDLLINLCYSYMCILCIATHGVIKYCKVLFMRGLAQFTKINLIHIFVTTVLLIMLRNR